MAKQNITETITAISAGAGGALAGGIIMQKAPANLKKFAPIIAAGGGAAGAYFLKNPILKNLCAGLSVIGIYVLVSKMIPAGADPAKPNLIPSLALSGWDDQPYQPTYGVNGLGNTEVPQYEKYAPVAGMGDPAFEGIDFQGVEDGVEGIEDGVEGIEDGTVAGLGEPIYE